MLTVTQLFLHHDCGAPSRETIRGRLAAGKDMAAVMSGELYSRRPAISELIFDEPDEDSVERDRIKAIMGVPIRPETTQYGTSGEKFTKMINTTGSMRSRAGASPTVLAPRRDGVRT